MRVLAEEAARERKAVADGLVRDLGRPATQAEMLLIESTAAQVVEGRKLRRQGRSSEMQDRLIVRTLTKLGIKPGAAKPTDPLEHIRARYARPPVAQNGDEESEAPNGHSELAP